MPPESAFYVCAFGPMSSGCTVFSAIGSQGELCGAEGKIFKNIVQLKCTTWKME